MRSITLLLLSIIIINWSWFSSLTSKNQPEWAEKIEKQISSLEKSFDGEVGIYVKDLKEGGYFSHKASQPWYLSSTVKIPVAIALYKMVDMGQLKLSEKTVVTKKDYRDGAGPVNWIKPGDKVSYKYLLRQMLMYSDNAATDLIIKKVGLNKVNAYVKEYVSGESFGPITTLLDVRKKAYSEFHPGAKNLTNLDYFAVKKQRQAEKKLNYLAKILKTTRAEMTSKTLSEGFFKYYANGWNSAPLISYATLLEKLVNGEILSSASTKKLLVIMSNIHTGKKRIKKGLPRKMFFAHKTGTQHKQACDVGIAGDKKTRKPHFLILVCVKKWKKLAKAEKLMAKVGRIVSGSGILKTKSE